MCGLAGIYSYRPSSNVVGTARLTSLLWAMARRGPDATGTWVGLGGRIQLGHRRLSIIDPREAGNQPMVDAESECSIVFNGEIYNYRELRAELMREGFNFHSQSDTEVLLKGYLHWGEGLLRKLRGMFAFAIWDPRKRGLWLVRDPYGIKPLYYSDHAGTFAFASQVNPLRTVIETDTRPEPAGVVGFLLLGSVPEPYTFCRGIRALPAGHAMWVIHEKVEISRKYASTTDIWLLAGQQPEQLEGAAFLERVRASLTASVSAHMVADVPVGAFLSAGVDSSALVGLMAEGHPASLKTVTLGFSRFRNTASDEVLHAERTAVRYGTQQHTAWITDEEAAADLPQILADMDQPSVDGFNTWLVSKHTAALGLKVAISGIGGDELFGGYEHFAQLPKWSRWLKRVGKLPALPFLLAKGLNTASGFGLVHAKAAALSRLGPDLAGLYLVRRGLFMPWELPGLIDTELVREGLAALGPPYYMQSQPVASCDNDYVTIAALEAASYLRNQLLRDSDWASMAHSLELRTPLVDFQLLRELAPVLAAPRPIGLSGKRGLALAPRPALTSDIFTRPKSGFSIPMGEWMEQTSLLDQWRGVPKLNHPRCHWSRRLAYAMAADCLGNSN